MVAEGVGVELRAVGAELRDRGEQGLVERRARPVVAVGVLVVAELVVADALGAEADLDPAQQVGGDALEAAARVDLHVGAARHGGVGGAQVAVADEGDGVRPLGGSAAGPGDALEVEVHARHRAALHARVADAHVVVAHEIVVRVADLAQRPEENVAGGVGERGVGDRAVGGRRAAVEVLHAALVGDLPPVGRGARAVADDAAELALDARAEDLFGRARDGFAAVRDRRELLAVEQVGFGFRGGVVARHAEARVDGDRGRGDVPADAHPAVAAAGVVLHRQLRLQAGAPGRQLDRVAEPGVAQVVGARRLDEVDLGAGVGGLDVLHRGRVEGYRLRRVGDRDHRVDHVGEVVGDGVHRLAGLVDRHALELDPAAGGLVEVKGLDVVLGVPRRDERLVVGQRDGDVFQEFRAVRQEAVAAARALGDVDHAGVERRQRLAGERRDGDGGVGRDRAGVDHELRFVVRDGRLALGSDRGRGTAGNVAGERRRRHDLVAQVHDARHRLAARVGRLDLHPPPLVVALGGEEVLAAVDDAVLADQDAEGAVGVGRRNPADADRGEAGAVVRRRREAADIGVAPVELPGVREGGVEASRAHQLGQEREIEVDARTDEQHLAELGVARVGARELEAQALDDPGLQGHGIRYRDRVPADAVDRPRLGVEGQPLAGELHRHLQLAHDRRRQIERDRVQLDGTGELEFQRRRLGADRLVGRVRLPAGREVAIDERGDRVAAGGVRLVGGEGFDEVGPGIELGHHAHVAHAVVAGDAGRQGESDGVGAALQPGRVDLLDLLDPDGAVGGAPQAAALRGVAVDRAARHHPVRGAGQARR